MSSTTRRSAHAWVSARSRRVPSGSGRPAGHDVERPVDVPAQDLGERLAQLLECRRQLRVVGVGVLRHQARRQEDGHRLALAQAERRQERLALQAPASAVRPDRDAQLVVERPQVAVGVAARHAEEAGQLVRRDSVGVGREVGRDAVEAGDAIALPARERVAPRKVPAIHASSGSVGGRRDRHRAAPARGGELRRQLAPDRVRLDLEAAAAQSPFDAAELAVGEDPDVDLAPPGVQVGGPDQPANLRKRRPEGSAVDGDPAAPGAGALDVDEPEVLGGGSLERGPAPPG